MFAALLTICFTASKQSLAGPAITFSESFAKHVRKSIRSCKSMSPSNLPDASALKVVASLIVPAHFEDASGAKGEVDRKEVKLTRLGQQGNAQLGQAGSSSSLSLGRKCHLHDAAFCAC